MTDRDATAGLLVDYGGVLTGSVGRSFRAYERAHDIPKGTILELLLAAYRDDVGGDDLVASIELGRIPDEEFDRLLAARLADAGYAVPPRGIVERLFDGMRPAGRVWDVVAQAKEQGVATGLLSNSWGTTTYPRERLADVFDVLVISGEVGLRKPDPAIYRLALDQLGVEPEACAFVDDLDRNVDVARSLGMFGVLHRDDVTTAAALAGFLGVPLEL
ncbi:MAG: HAD family phosphatase [Actinobacteria bacterium]|nr:HAD family phosphatase [Actinomycetota bacterium]